MNGNGDPFIRCGLGRKSRDGHGAARPMTLSPHASGKIEARQGLPRNTRYSMQGISMDRRLAKRSRNT
jgi:hypothetical protein